MDNDSARKFIIACDSGHIEEAKRIYSLGELTLDDAFYEACFNDCKEVSKWLYSLGDISNLQCTFNVLCQLGHISIIKWMYSIGGINIHACDSIAFHYACIFNCLNVARFLHSIDPTIYRTHPEYLDKYTLKDIESIH